MKLFVDDYRPAPPGWTWAKNVSTAIRMLDTMPVEVVALDHDIKDSTETFEPVARHMVALVLAKKIPETTPVYIHTGNPVGGNYMSELLKEAGCCRIEFSDYSSYFGMEGQQV